MSKEAVEEMRQYYGLDKPLHVRYAMWLWNVLRLDLGNSLVNQEPVWDVIKSRFPVSIFLGLTGFLLSYIVCIPLGVWKAVKHGSAFDFASSVVIFVGYCIPGWALGTGLLVLFGGGSFWNIFPLGGFRPENWDSLDFPHKIVSQLYYMALPVFCYMIGEFARLTILTKNSMIETLSQDYIRTAFAKGLTGKRVVLGHALRNSLIPIATGLGHQLSLILAGSFLIEKAFNIRGMGLLGYESLRERDYPVALGILVISSLLMMLGNLLSDFFCAVVDPRVRFE
jgi:microcin C transport system permease protein